MDQLNIQKTKVYAHFIGIDVSAYELDFAVMKGSKFLFHKEIKNSPQEILAFIAELKELPSFRVSKAVFCMEHTGIYANHLLNTLKRVKADIVYDNPLQIKNSFGLTRGKWDKVDAMRIAQYVFMNRDNLSLYNPKRPMLQQLANLFSLRNRLLGIQTALQTPLTSQLTFIKKEDHSLTVKACRKSMAAIKEDLLNIDRMIDQIIADDENFSRLIRMITSVPSVGRITAIQIIISTNEFKSISSPRKFACYAGVAPFKKESGGVKYRAKVSPIANRKMKALLHTCAMISLRSIPEIREYYDRKVAEGKSKMSVLNAIRNKLILRIFSCVNQERLYNREYMSKMADNEPTDNGSMAYEALPCLSSLQNIRQTKESKGHVSKSYEGL